jgi:hypothetical protein
MVIQKIFLLLIVSCFIYGKPESLKIEVIGKAMNAKGGAVVISDDNGVFYLDGLDKWNEKFYEKKVKVTGKLMIKEWEKRDDGEIRAEIAGPQKIIKKPKWVLVD